MFGILAGPAGASSTLTSSDGFTTLTTNGSVTTGTPYVSGQKLTVAVASNNTLSSTNLSSAGAPTTGNFFVEECVDPGGLVANLPTAASGCESTTDNTSAPKSANGSLTLTGINSFVVYDLPDPLTLGAGTMTGVCDISPNQCVLGIFAANPQSSNGFSFPHLFSAPFQVSVGDGNDTGDNPGDGTPEVPLALLLPLAGAAVIGGGALVQHRRRRRVA